MTEGRSIYFRFSCIKTLVLFIALMIVFFIKVISVDPAGSVINADFMKLLQREVMLGYLQSGLISMTVISVIESIIAWKIDSEKKSKLIRIGICIFLMIVGLSIFGINARKSVIVNKNAPKVELLEVVESEIVTFKPSNIFRTRGNKKYDYIMEFSNGSMYKWERASGLGNPVGSYYVVQCGDIVIGVYDDIFYKV
ncbi:MAG: hypothetical protein J6U54_15750 [Clostridiales bacterium]|nr:hypothetical protein [Clostridiales bacterium]